MINFDLQDSIQACPVFTLYFNCLVFTLDDYTMEDCWLEEKYCYFKNRLTCQNKNNKIGFTSSEKKKKKKKKKKMKELFSWPTVCTSSIKSKKKRIAGNEVLSLQNKSH